jgi:hypothetical protein
MRVHKRAGRRRSAALAAAFATCGGLAAVAGLLGAAPASADAITINVFYPTATSLQVKLSDGTAVNAGSAIPAGSYQVLVYDATGDDANPNFKLSGPGVSIASNLNSTGMGIDYPATFGPFTFQPNASYTVSDPGIGASVSFSTSAAAGGAGAGGQTTTGGAGAGGSTSGGTGAGGSSSSGSSAAGGSAHTGGAGSAGSLRLMGTVEATVTGSGRASLTFGGKPVKTLKAGRYTVTVADHSTTAGLIIGQGAKSPITVSGAAAVGTGSKTVTLVAGKAFYEPTLHGPRTPFSVVS